jgi:4-oxalocrotonate tautomerase
MNRSTKITRRSAVEGGMMLLSAMWSAPHARAAQVASGPIKSSLKGTAMPLARIDLSSKASPALVRVVSEAIYKAMIEVANVPVHDKFQIVSRHAPDEIIYPEEGYLGIQYSQELVMIQVTWVSGRSTEVKKKFFQQIASEIHEKGGIRKEDVWISLVESGREDWSFGNGEMQYAPKS